MSTITREEFHKACVLLKENVGKKKHDTSCGICANLEQILGDDTNFFEYMHTYIQSWPLYTGIRTYPVPDDGSGLSPEDAYNRMINLWRGEYGKNRKNLLNHLIEVSR
jgi:hypothetical protein